MHDFRKASDRRTDDRERGRHRLENDEREPLGEGRQRKDVHRCEQIGHVRTRAQEMYETTFRQRPRKRS